MNHEQQIVIKRWIPILEEYERSKNKQAPRVSDTSLKYKNM